MQVDGDIISGTKPASRWGVRHETFYTEMLYYADGEFFLICWNGGQIIGAPSLLHVGYKKAATWLKKYGKSNIDTDIYGMENQQKVEEKCNEDEDEDKFEALLDIAFRKWFMGSYTPINEEKLEVLFEMMRLDSNVPKKYRDVITDMKRP